MADLKSLKTKRGNINGQLTRFEKFLTEVKDENLSQLPERIRRCEEMFDQFNEVQEQIEEIDETELQKNERDVFEESYYKLIGNAKCLMSKQKSGDIAVPKTVKKVNLPTIEITPFYGSYKSWLEFRDAFTSMVDKGDDLTPIQKFFYLKSLVKGAAAEVIQSLEVCDKNYTEAWKLLQDSFENDKLIAISHIESLCEFPPLQRESYTRV